MKKHHRLLVTCLATAVVTAFWVFLVILPDTSLSQLSCFVLYGKVPMLDWNFIRHAADFSDAYVNVNLPEVFAGAGPIRKADICNPALAMLLVRIFPATFGWGVAVTALGTALYLLAAAFYLRRRVGVAAPWAAGTLVATLPFYAAFLVGNVILFAAAAGLVFLALYDSESRHERVVAALALAFAFAVKISPVALGVLYFAAWRKQWRYAALAAGVAVLLLLVPFAAYGGLEGFGNWLSCAAANSAYYESRNIIGLYGVFYALSAAFGKYWQWYPSAHGVMHMLSAMLGLGALAVAAWGRKTPVERTFLATAGMVMLPPTMMIYTLLFALPTMLALPGRAAALAFVAVVSPLQVFIAGYSIQPLLSAAAFLFLAVGVLLPNRSER